MSGNGHNLPCKALSESHRLPNHNDHNHNDHNHNDRSHNDRSRNVMPYLSPDGQLQKSCTARSGHSHASAAGWIRLVPGSVATVSALRRERD